jgi:hypothetical protein
MSATDSTVKTIVLVPVADLIKTASKGASKKAGS